MKKLILAILMTICLVSSIAVGFMGDWDDIIPDGWDDYDNDDGSDYFDDGSDEFDDGSDYFDDGSDEFDDEFDGWDDDNDYDHEGDDDFQDDEFDGWDDDEEWPEKFPPVAVIECIASTDVNQVVIMDGSKSYDPDGEIVSYEWDFGDGNSDTGADTDHVYTTEGIYTIVLKVTDNEGKSDTDKVTITVEDFDDGDENNNPVITSEPVTETDIGIRYTYDVEAEDADNDTLIYSLTESPEEMTINPTTGLIEWRAEEEGEYDVIVIVEDGNGGSDSQSYIINVEEEDDDDGEEIIIDNKLAVRAKISGDEYIPAGNTVRVRTSVENIGANDLENIRISAGIQELAVRDMSGSFELDEGEETSKSLYLEIPEHTEQGVYSVRLSYSNDDTRRIIYREITVI